MQKVCSKSPDGIRELWGWLGQVTKHFSAFIVYIAITWSKSVQKSTAAVDPQHLKVEVAD